MDSDRFKQVTKIKIIIILFNFFKILKENYYQIKHRNLKENKIFEIDKKEN